MTTSPSSPSAPARSSSTGWRVARRLLVAAAALATLIAVFYTVENWRGKRAWEKRRQELEARGAVLDWGAYVPAPVPDDQNFYKAPKMQEWFVRDHFAILGPVPRNAPKPFALTLRHDTNLVVAEVKLVAPDVSLDSQSASSALRLDDRAARGQAAKLLREAIGPCAIGPRSSVLLARPLGEVKPLHLVLLTDSGPAAKQLATMRVLNNFFPRNPVPTNWALAYSATSYLQVEPAGRDTFRVLLKAPVYGAADYLAWTDSLTPQLDLVRKALERPYARIDCDYQQPFGIAIPNFIALRDVSQTLAQRAQCHLLLGEPEAAWRELALIHDLCGLLAAKPPAKPITLVGAMINAAIMGLCIGVVEDGLRLQAWHEPQLLALERQLQETDLLTPVMKAFEEERAATCRTLETTPRSELAKLLYSDRFWPRLGLTCLPQGWFYQNMVVGTGLEQEWLESVDLTNRLVPARRISEAVHRASLEFGQNSPHSFLALRALPNFLKALQTATLDQTLVNEAELGCALERHRLAEGRFPETLDALAPQFIEKLPHDLIGGQPLKYRRTDSGGYLLYSVGWNEKDDGGVVGLTQNGNVDRETGDWVWRYPQS
jgi:hypothetical protein